MNYSASNGKIGFLGFTISGINNELKVTAVSNSSLGFWDDLINI